MNFDVVVAAAVVAALAKHNPKSNVSKNTTATKAITRFRRRQLSHRAAKCRTPTIVVAGVIAQAVGVSLFSRNMERRYK
ncbi:hypothetical protein CCR75_004932 [Bremia lactucae]|uniref:Uncharacterized protein n=1 Tax=Bremia lactucae TaxID=4779 RepID=A0A976FIW3_BRELC|nr:hypothetical protein CCR75_004932 [Bremia lactucae]